MKNIFQENAYRIPISSIKSMLGHTMGAASAIEAGTCALALFHDRIPPTINLFEPDPLCDLDYVPNNAREHPVRVRGRCSEEIRHEGMDTCGLVLTNLCIKVQHRVAVVRKYRMLVGFQNLWTPM